MDVEEIHKEHASIIAFGNQSESQNVVNSPFGQICMDTMLMTKN